DWRQDEARKIDTRTVDIIAATRNLLDVDHGFMLLSGYRSPKTNAMLRSRSSGVAKKSLHMIGKAADLRCQGRSVGQLARAAASVSGGGVGRYSGSNFVHVDCGAVRSWGR
ncbi:MAG: YcbK family protein, partial [Shimia sp.]